MHKKYLKGKITPQDCAQLLKDNGITKEVLFKIFDKEYFNDESNTHGGKAKIFSDEFKDSMDSNAANNNVNVSNLSQDRSKVYVVANTGSNGTELKELQARKAINASGFIAKL